MRVGAEQARWTPWAASSLVASCLWRFGVGSTIFIVSGILVVAFDSLHSMLSMQLKATSIGLYSAFLHLLYLVMAWSTPTSSLPFLTLNYIVQQHIVSAV